MLNLILATLCTSLVSILMRVSGKYTRNNLTMLACNYVVCVIMAGAFAGGNLLPAHDGLWQAIGLGMAGGFFYLASFMLMQWNMKTNGVVLPNTFMKLGTIIPILIAVFIFGEAPRAVQITGILLAMAAVVWMQEKGEGVQSLKGLLLLWVTTGFSSAMSKIYDEIGVPELKNQFLFYIFCTALILCVVVCIIRRQKLALMNVVWGVIIGIPNYLTSRFLLLSMKDVPAFLVYPIYSVSSIVIVTLTGMFVFGEKISRRKKTALCVILLALVLLNL